MTGPASPLSARHDARCAWWCCTPTKLHPAQLLRVLRRQVLRVQVVGDHGRLDVEQPPVVRDALGERAQRLGVLQVPDVVRQERVRPAGQAERALELGAAAQHGTADGCGQGERLGGVAAGAADRQHAAALHPDDRVVGAGVDRPVVGEHGVGDRDEPADVGVAVDDRLVRHVPAGQHDRRADLRGEQVVQRGVGEQHADVPVARRHGRRERGARPAAEQDDRRAPGGQCLLLDRVDLGQGPGRWRGRGRGRRTACPPGACGSAAPRRRTRRRRGRRGGSRRGP